MKRIKKSLLPISTFATIDVKRLFRDKVAIFFVFIFPLIFLLVFGGIFGRDSDISFKVAMINESQSQFSREFVEQARQDRVLKIDEKVKTLEEAKTKMNRGELDATIILSAGFGEVKTINFLVVRQLFYMSKIMNKQEEH
jgi:ABC-2 type transport system permease protein